MEAISTVSALNPDKSRNTLRPFSTYAKTHGSEESDTPDKAVTSETQVGRSGTGPSKVVVQSSIVVHFLVVSGRIGLDEVDTIVRTGNSVLLSRIDSFVMSEFIVLKSIMSQGRRHTSAEATGGTPL